MRVVHKAFVNSSASLECAASTALCPRQRERRIFAQGLLVQKG
jgi:hypothetical protein